MRNSIKDNTLEQYVMYGGLLEEDHDVNITETFEYSIDEDGYITMGWEVIPEEGSMLHKMVGNNRVVHEVVYSEKYNEIYSNTYKKMGDTVKITLIPSREMVKRIVYYYLG